MEPYWDLIKRIITESDVVLEILDARLVELSRNELVENLITEIGRPLIFVINKKDLVSPKILRNQVKKLKKLGTVVFISTKRKQDIKILLYVIKKVFKQFGKRELPLRNKYDQKPKFREAKGDIVAGVLGYPNVGKSSIINALSHKKKMKVSKHAGTTHGIHWIKANNEIKLIDSPGVIPLQKDDDLRYGLIGARDIETLRNPELVAHAIINLFLKYNQTEFEKHYDITINNGDTEIIINQIAQRKRFILKGNQPDENRTFQIIIKDWQEGNLRL